jgi:PAS domain S-box-containing protein
MKVMKVTADTPDPSKQREIQAELTELRRRIAELEQTKRQLEQRCPTPATTAETPPPVTSPDELARMMLTFVRRVATILQAEKCVIMLYDAEADLLVAQRPALKFTDDEIERFQIPPGVGLTGSVYREGTPLICHDCVTDPRSREEVMERWGVRDSLSVPMIVERRDESQQVTERKVIGVIHVFNKRYDLQFTDEDIRLLTVLARNAAAVISSARAFQAITSEKKQLEYTIQSMAAGLLVVSQTGRIQLLNGAAAHILGLMSDTAIGHAYEALIHDQGICEFLGQALAQGGDILKEFLIGERIYQIQTAQVRDDHAHGVGILCIFHDVTELRNVDRMKSDFVSTVSHELRTPLTAIKGFARTLLDDPTGEVFDQEMRMEFYGIIDSECDRLTRLISDLLNVSRIERGLPLQLNFSTIALAALVDKCINFHRGYTVKHELSAHLPPDLPAIIADQDKVDQILSNLIGNAIKYSPDGGHIVVSAVDEGDKLRFSVSDQGMGIPLEHLDKIFQRFHRVHSGDSQRVGGTGLGLFLSKSLVEAHHGVIWVVSTLGEGSTFYFTLPKQPAREG